MMLQSCFRNFVPKTKVGVHFHFPDISTSGIFWWAQDLKQLYLCVSCFSDEAYTQAAVFPTVYDKKQIWDEAWEETDSSKVLKKEENRRNKTGRPKTSHQIFDSKISKRRIRSTSRSSA